MMGKQRGQLYIFVAMYTILAIIGCASTFTTTVPSFATSRSITQSTATHISSHDDDVCIYTNALTTASGKPICRYALGGAARSTQPESLPLKYQEILTQQAGHAAPIYFYYNPHRYEAFMSGVRESFSNDKSTLTRKDVFLFSGGSEFSIEELDDRLNNALVHSDGEYLDAFVLEYICPYELSSDKQQIGSDLEQAIAHLHEWKKKGKVRYVMASTHSHLVGSVLASAQMDGMPVFDALMLRYNMSHKNAAESLSLSAALENNIPVLAFTTTRWNRLQSNSPNNDRPYPTTSDCIKFALQHPGVEIVIHSARDEEELDDAILPLLSASATKQSAWLSEDEYDQWRIHGNDEVKWNDDDSFDEYPEESII
jgi:aryl-alcohol dehydrogenase-like predicted oxidoreductase